MKIYEKRLVRGCKYRHYLFGVQIATTYERQQEVLEAITLESSKADKQRILVVIPSDKLSEYEEKRYFDLEGYYNPNKFFDKVFCLSPLECGYTKAYGMFVAGVSPQTYRKALKIIRPNVVRAYGGYWASTFAIKNKVDSIPIISSVHDSNPKMLYKEVLKADKVIAVSKCVIELLKQRGVKESKIELLPNRVDIANFYPLSVEQLEDFPKDFKYILSVGRLCEEKNIDTLIKSLALLPSEYRCIIIGDGEEGEYMGLAKELGVDSKIIWRKAVANKSLPLYYSFVDCFCTPSRSEGFGIVFIEAMACGAAVVTSNIAPMNEFIKHKESGHLVDEYENPEALAKAILKVCQDKEYATHIKQGAIKAAKRFDKRAIDAQEAKIYENIIREQNDI